MIDDYESNVLHTYPQMSAPVAGGTLAELRASATGRPPAARLAQLEARAAASHAAVTLSGSPAARELEEGSLLDRLGSVERRQAIQESYVCPIPIDVVDSILNLIRDSREGLSTLVLARRMSLPLTVVEELVLELLREEDALTRKRDGIGVMVVVPRVSSS